MIKKNGSLERSRKIMVVDDDNAVSDVIKFMLEDRGYEVMLLDNGQKFMNKVKFFKPDLVLLDIWMPGLGGNEITKKLKLDKNLRHIPVILISALNNIQDFKLDCGADDYLEKPFSMKALISKVGKYVN